MKSDELKTVEHFEMIQFFEPFLRRGTSAQQKNKHL